MDPSHIVGIVGSEAAKFTPETEAKAREEIRRLIANADVVCSGECHLGGIDIWTREEAVAAGKPFLPYPPARHTWEGGYKQRNIKIADTSTFVACITVKELPSTYRGMRFPSGCYHCHTPADHHVKSGGCWTMKRARDAGKETELVVIA